MKPLYKILIGITALVVLVAAGYFIWWLFLEEPGGETSQGGSLPEGTGGNVPAATSTPRTGENARVPLAISDHAAFDYWLVPETGEVFYLTPQGFVYAAKEGPDLEISRQTITALNRAEPSSDGRRLLVSFGNPSARQWAIFDTVDSVWRPLPREVMNAGWGRSPRELVASVVSGSDTNLSFIDISKTPFAYTTLVRNFQMEDVEFSLATAGSILIAERPSSLFPTRTWLFNISDRSLNLIFAPTNGLWITRASPSQETFFKFTPDAGTSIVSDLSGRSSEILLPFFTFPDKCAMTDQAFYCFVPKEMAQRSFLALPDGYFQAKLRLEDIFVTGTVATSTASVIGDVSSPWGSAGAETYDASHVRTEKNTAYFIDRYTDKLYRFSFGE